MSEMKQFLEIDEENILYHGSPEKYDILIPHQAYDTGFEEGCQNAVYATSNKNMALAFALGGVPNADGELERVMMPEYGDKMIFKKGTPNYGGKGYLYILKKDNFRFAMGTQWVCFENVIPLDVIEIDVDDYLDICVVEEKR